MKKTYISLLSTTCLIASLLGWELTPPDAQGKFIAQENNLRLEFTPVFRTAQYLTLPIKSAADQSFQVLNTNGQPQARFQFSASPENTPELSWEYQKTAAGELDSAYLSVKLPVRVWQGLLFSAKDTELRLPVHPAPKPKLAAQYSNQATIGIAPNQTRIQLSRPCYWELYDLRTWHTPAYELRIYLAGRASDFKDSKQHLEIHLETTKPFEYNEGKTTLKEVHPVTSEWTPFSINWDDPATPVWDFSQSIDAPAGKYGFAKVDGPHFRFGNGKRLRMWGVNVASSANFPRKEDAAKVVGYLRRIGINAIRFAHLDSTWYRSLIDYRNKQNLAYHEDNFDRFFYFLNELRKAGIYYVLDGRHGFEFKTEEFHYLDKFWQNRGCNLLLYFSSAMQRHHKSYLRKLLLTRNPYSGVALADDPALAGLQMLNETFLLRNGDRVKKRADIPVALLPEFDAAWQAFVPAFNPKTTTYDDASIALRREFFSWLERRYFKEMTQFYRNEIKVKSPLATTSCYIGFAALPSAVDGEYTEGHSYYSLPQDEDLLTSDNLELGKNRKMRLSRLPDHPGYYDNNHLRWLPFSLQQRIGYQPYVMGEWNHVHPFPERFDGPLWMTLLSNIQDFDGMFLFTIAHSPWETIRERNCDVLIGFEDPSTILNMIPAALVWHRGQLGPARRSVEVTVPSQDLFNKHSESYMLYGENALSMRMYNCPDIPGMRHVPQPDLKLTNSQRVAIVNPALKREADTANPVLIKQNHVIVNAPKFASIFGNVGGEPITAGLMTLSAPIGSEYSVSFNSLDDKPLQQASRALITICPVSLANGSSFIERVDNVTGERLARWTLERMRNNPRVKPFSGKLKIHGDWRIYQVSNAGTKGTQIASPGEMIHLGGKEPIYFFLLEREMHSR